MAKGRIIKLIIADDSRLEKMAERGHSPLVWSLIIALILIGVFLVAGTIIMLTPLHTLLPGYMKESQRNSTLDNIMRIDSLRNVAELNRKYINNLATILDTDRVPSDSATLVVNSNPLTTDSLLDTSQAEKNFVKMMEEREKYNISILAPLAAEGMLFGEINPGAVITEATINSETASVIIPSGGVICSMTNGRVIDVHYDNVSQGYVVMMQHPNGFVSRYSRLQLPIVKVGQRIDAGGAICVAPSSGVAATNTINVEMWRNGDALIPSKYIGSTINSAGNAEPAQEEGRGRL